MNRCKIDIYRPEETGALVSGLDDTGTIVSVFDKAVNIRVSNRLLVSVVRNASAMTPMSIHCPAMFDPKEVRFGLGQTVNVKDGILAGDGWHMDIRGSKRYQGFPRVENRSGISASTIDLFEKVLHLTGRKEGLLGVTRSGTSQNAFARKGRQIVDHIMSRSRPHLAVHLAKFTGLGPGFTPSGDDLICGFLMGEAFAQGENRLFPDAAPFKQLPVLDEKEKAVLRQAAQGTCDAGRTLIWMALKGRFPKFLCLAAEELNGADTAKDMLAMVTKATRYGHTSGTDALTGLLLYLKTCHRHARQNRLREKALSLPINNRSLFSGQ